MLAPDGVTVAVVHVVCSQQHSDDKRDVTRASSPDAESAAIELQSASVDRPTESTSGRQVERLISGVKVSLVEIGFEHDVGNMTSLLTSLTLYFLSTASASSSINVFHFKCVHFVYCVTT